MAKGAEKLLHSWNHERKIKRMNASMKSISFLEVSILLLLELHYNLLTNSTAYSITVFQHLLGKNCSNENKIM